MIAFCSQSYVIRWVHVIRDHCCQHVSVRFHVPGTYVRDSMNLPEGPSRSEDEDEDYDDVN